MFFYIYQTLTCFQGTSGNFKLINEKNENLFLTAPLSISLAASTTLVTPENLRVGQWTHPAPHIHCKPACFPYFIQFAVKWRREAWHRAVLQFGRHIIRRRKRNQLLSTFQCDVRLSLCGENTQEVRGSGWTSPRKMYIFHIKKTSMSFWKHAELHVRSR